MLCLKSRYFFYVENLGFQSFTSLVADLRLERNRIFHIFFLYMQLRTVTRYTSSLLNCITQSLTEHFLQGNVLLNFLLNAKPTFISWRGYVSNEVNDLVPKEHRYRFQTKIANCCHIIKLLWALIFYSVCYSML